MRDDVTSPEPAEPMLAIGQVAERTGLAVSAIRFYEDRGLVRSERSSSGHRRFGRSVIRRLSFIMVAQRLGYRLDEIATQLDTLPSSTAPTDQDWERLATGFEAELTARIEALVELRDKLDGCIGCGCLSLSHCALYNDSDRAAERGPGPRYLLGDRPPTVGSERRITTEAGER